MGNGVFAGGIDWLDGPNTPRPSSSSATTAAAVADDMGHKRLHMCLDSPSYLSFPASSYYVSNSNNYATVVSL